MPAIITEAAVFPNMHNRVPQHMMALYLGITAGAFELGEEGGGGRGDFWARVYYAGGEVGRRIKKHEGYIK